MNTGRIGPVMDAIYASAVTPDRQPALLAELAGLFRCHFADSFARTAGFTQYRGIAHGLDRADYEDEFLGSWVKRNVWGARRPVQRAGDVVTTREMVPREEFVRSAMYNEYLAPRGLHEGLRLDVWAGEGWIEDVSLLRSWSAGPCTTAETELARGLLPHLQRAAAVARRLREATDLARAGAVALDALQAAVLLLDEAGRLVHANVAGAALLARRDGLTAHPAGLAAASPALTAALRAMALQAAGAEGRRALAGTLRLPRPSGKPALALVALPLRGETEWRLSRRPAALVFVTDPDARANLRVDQITQLFGLTAAEAALAADLVAGREVRDIAERTGRSVHTLRTHLARLLAKTETTRQTDLVRLLIRLPRTHNE